MYNDRIAEVEVASRLDFGTFWSFGNCCNLAEVCIINPAINVSIVSGEVFEEPHILLDCRQ